jgi:hypothetical protein
VRGQDGADPGVDGGLEGQQFAAAQQVGVGLHHGQGVVRVLGCGAVAGKVLGARGHPGLLQALDGGGGVPGDQFGVGPEGAGTDHRVVVGDVDVHRGSQVQVEAHTGQLDAQRAQGGPGEVGVVHRAQGRVAGVVAAPGLADAGDVAALLVKGDQRGVRGLAQARVERGDLFGALQVVVEQADAGDPVREPVQDPSGGLKGLEGHQQRGVGQTLQCRVVRHDELRSVSRGARKRADA